MSRSRLSASSTFAMESTRKDRLVQTGTIRGKCSVALLPEGQYDVLIPPEKCKSLRCVDRFSKNIETKYMLVELFRSVQVADIQPDVPGCELF